MLKAIYFSIKTAWQIDKVRVFYEIGYNLVKQFFNVFYGVYFLRTILVYIETGRDLSSILLVLGFMLAVNILFYLLNNYFKEVYLPRFDIMITQQVYEKIVIRASHVPYDVYNQPRFLDLYQRILENTVPNIQKVLNALGTMCGLIIALVMVAFYVVQVDIFAILLSILPLFYSYFLSQKAEKYRFELNKNTTNSSRKKRYAQRIFYLPQYAKELKMTAVSSAVQHVYDEGVQENIRQHKKFGKKITLFQFIDFCIGDVFIVMLPIAYVAIRVLTGSSFMIGDFIGIAQSITYFSWDLEWFADMVLQIKSASLYLKEYKTYMEMEKVGPSGECAGQKSHDLSSFTLVCKNVFYRYPGSPKDSYTLRNVNLTIRQGEKIAIVGENGAGKSTLVHLLMHLLSCTEGSICLNGINLDDFTPNQLKSFFGVVLQDFHLYPVSVRENICVNGPLNDAVLWSAIEKMGLQNCITDLDARLTKEFSDDGLELSGGQQQKLALTRVIANPYPFVILDEPTSALDPIAEREIYRLVLQAAAGKTLLFISHRLATTRFVDRILVLKDGMIIEEGNHQQLMAAKGYYYELYTLQESMYRERSV